MYAMLSLELDKKTTASAREKLDAHLRDGGWMKLAKVSTTWFTRYKATAAELDIIEEVKVDVAEAAKYSGVSRYDAAVNVSQSEPSFF